MVALIESREPIGEGTVGFSAYVQLGVGRRQWIGATALMSLQLTGVSMFAASDGGAVSIGDPTSTERLVVPFRPLEALTHRIVLPPVDQPEFTAADDARRIPLQVGVHRTGFHGLGTNITSKLAWEADDDGRVHTDITVTSSGSLDTRVALTVELPPDGLLYFFGSDRSVLRSATVPGDAGVRSFWSPAFRGDTVGIQVSLPGWEAVPPFTLAINKVSHGNPRDVRAALDDGDLECDNHVEIQCRATDAGSATALIRAETKHGPVECTGTLLNVSRDDGFIPYVLTSNSCVADAAEALSVEVQWHYQRATCDSEEVDPRTETTTGGADLLATSIDQDATLLRLRRPLPSGLTLAGWDAGVPDHPLSVIGVHHPGGGFKKYAGGRTTGSRTVSAGGRRISNAIEVRWTEGTTEAGSRGSGLFSNNGGHLIGVNTAERGSCTSRRAYYGSLSDFWPQARRWLIPSVPDDHGDTMSMATVVPVPSTTSGTLSGSGDIDYFEFEVTRAGWISVESTGNVDTIGRLRDEADNVISEDDDGGSSYPNFLIEQAIEPGTYFVEVVGHQFGVTGAYELAIDFDPRTDDHGDTHREATAVSLPTSVKGYLEQQDDQDFFRIEVVDAGHLQVQSAGRTDVFGTLMHEGLGTVAENDDAGGRYNFSLAADVTPGTYFVKVEGSHAQETGPYGLDIWFSALGIRFGDMDGDGKADVLLRGTDGAWTFYAMNGGTPIGRGRSVPLESSLHWAFAGTGDLNGDGLADVLLRHTEGGWYYFPMSGGRPIADEEGPIDDLPSDLAWKLVGIGDLNGDGNDDVLLRHVDGQWLYYVMQGRRVVGAPRSPSLKDDPQWRFAGIGDLNGDRTDDVLLRHSDGRWYYHPFANGAVNARMSAAADLPDDVSWRFAGLGDLNGDGRDDVLLRHVDGRWDYLPMDGNRHLEAGRGGTDLRRTHTYALAGIGDFNGDGRDDVMLRAANGRWEYYPMRGNRSITEERGFARLPRNRALVLPQGVAAPITAPRQPIRVVTPAARNASEPHYMVAQHAGDLQYWVDQGSGVVTESLMSLYDGSSRVRMFNDPDSGAPQKIVDEVSGEYVVLRENGVGRMDLWSYDDDDAYLGGVAFVEKDGRYYVAEITGLPANAGQQLAGQMASSVSSTTGSYSLTVEGGEDLGPLEELPAELGEFVTQLDGFFGVGATTSTAYSTLGHVASNSRPPNFYRLDSDAPDSTARAKVVRGLAALGGVALALKTGQAPQVLGRVAKTVISAGLTSYVRGCDVLGAVAGSVVDELSVCKLGVYDIVKNVCDAGVAILAGETDGKSPAEVIGEAVVGTFAPPAFGQAKKLVDFTRDLTDRVSEPGDEPEPGEGEQPPPVDGNLSGNAVFQTGDIFNLSGTVSTGGRFNVDGCPAGTSGCATDDMLSIRGTVDGKTISGTYEHGDDNGSVSGSVASLGDCETSFGSGGEGTFSFAHFVGYGTGASEFFYDAYSIPDKFTVSTSKGQKYTTGRLVSGSDTVSLQLDDEPTVYVNVSAPNTGTAWEYRVGCLR